MRPSQADQLINIMVTAWRGQPTHAVAEYRDILQSVSYAKGARAVHALCQRPMWPTPRQLDAALRHGGVIIDPPANNVTPLRPAIPRTIIPMEESAAWARKIREEFASRRDSGEPS